MDFRVVDTVSEKLAGAACSITFGALTGAVQGLYLGANAALSGYQQNTEWSQRAVQVFNKNANAIAHGAILALTFYLFSPSENLIGFNTLITGPATYFLSQKYSLKPLGAVLPYVVHTAKNIVDFVIHGSGGFFVGFTSQLDTGFRVGKKLYAALGWPGSRLGGIVDSIFSNYAFGKMRSGFYAGRVFSVLHLSVLGALATQRLFSMAMDAIPNLVLSQSTAEPNFSP